jgi:hypothetical protein
VVGFCEYGNDSLDYINGEFLNQLSDSHLLKKWWAFVSVVMIHQIM